MGEVWCATDRVLDRSIAVKLLRGDIADDRDLLRRFRTEARHAAALTHPGVARVYDYGEEGPAGSTAFLVMELVDGQPVSAAVRRGPLPPAVVVGLLTQAADALGAAHAAGLVHRDVKPGNLLLSPDGVVKITDFGIAHAIGAAPVTDDGKVAGTARYMSPEQATGGPIAATSDVYSLAVVGYELLTGHTPFDGPPAAVALAHVRALPPPLPPDVPDDLRDLIERSMSKDPTQRPANGAAMARELRAVVDAPVGVDPEVSAASTPTVLDATKVWVAPAGRESDPTTPNALVGVPQAARTRLRRRLAVGVTALLVAALAVLAMRAMAEPEPTGQIPAPVTATTIIDAPSTPATPTAPAPTVTTATPTTAPTTPPTTAAAVAPNNGKHNGKGKGKNEH